VERDRKYSQKRRETSLGNEKEDKTGVRGIGKHDTMRLGKKEKR